MMRDDLSDKVIQWSLEGHTNQIDFNEIYAAIDYLIRVRFQEYDPTIGPHPDFRTRFAQWLNNKGLSNEDQKILFRLLEHIFFIGRDDYRALYRAAYNGPVLKWIIDELGLTFNSIDIAPLIEAAVSQTWFCPVTDWDIGTFYRINGITGIKDRPGFRALAHGLSDALRIEDYMAKEKLKRIVLIEDFVGSGSQMAEVKPLLASLSKGISVLIVPLIICPSGIQEGTDLQKAYQNVSFSPVLKLPSHRFVGALPAQEEPILFASVRDLVKRVYSLVSGGKPAHPKVKPYGPFGFARTGGLVVLYSNCPDNTLPVIHHESNTWSPLFPRSCRE